MIEIMTPAQVVRARRTGALVGTILQSLRERSVVGTNLLDIDRWAKAMILEAGAVSCYVDYAPSFGRGPFGHYICTAVNDAVPQRVDHGDALGRSIMAMLSAGRALPTTKLMAESAATPSRRTARSRVSRSPSRSA